MIAMSTKLQENIEEKIFLGSIVNWLEFSWAFFVPKILWDLRINHYCNAFVPNAPFLYLLKTSENLKPYGFLMFSGGRERMHWEQMGLWCLLILIEKKSRHRLSTNIKQVPQPASFWTMNSFVNQNLKKHRQNLLTALCKTRRNKGFLCTIFSRIVLN